MIDILELLFFEMSDFRFILALMICFTLLGIFMIRGPAMFDQSSVVRWTSRDAVQVHLDPLYIPFSLDVLRDGRDGGSSAGEAAPGGSSAGEAAPGGSSASEAAPGGSSAGEAAPGGSSAGEAAPGGSSAGEAAPGAVVCCQLKTERPCRVRLLWRVPFSALSRLLNQITASDVLLYSCQTLSYDPGEHTIEAADSGGAPEDMSTSRKSHYPLVAAVETTSVPESPSSVVALLVVIHVRDAGAPMPTAALHRYVRQADGRVTLLQPLYSSGVEGQPQQQADEPVSEEGEGEEAGPLGVCCVCRAEPAAVVLLPCRHGCVCRACFARTDTCPLCRGRVVQYFNVPPPVGGRQGRQDCRTETAEMVSRRASHAAPADTE